MLHKTEFVVTHPEVRMGMTAYTIDGEKLGTVERIDEDNVTIEKGWFFRKDFLISYDDIEDVREDQVILRHRREEFKERRTESFDESRESSLTGGQAGRGESGRGREEMRGYGREEEETRIPLQEEELEARKREREGEVRKEDVKVETRKPEEEKR